MSLVPATGSQKALPDSPLATALTALESLTAIVDQLSALGEAGSDVRLAALAEQLRTVAQQILEDTGFAAPATDETQEVTARADKSSPSSEVSAVIAATQQSLGQVAELLRAAKRGAVPASPAPAPASAPPAPSAAAASSAPAPSAGAPAHTTPASSEVLQKLLTAVQGLVAVTTEQQQRLGRVEKQVGMPNSAPPAEHVSAPPEEELGWPMDLNAPKNRHVVDKSVSFHDP